MKLFGIVGVSKLNKTFYTAFCFLKHEDGDTSKWALGYLTYLHKNYIPSNFPTTVITDRDLVLISV
jgi:hypothetical protein